jgi:hypothetical protein
MYFHQAERTAKRDDDDDDIKPRKSEIHSVYYVSSKVNGRFGKSVRSYKPDEFE